MKREDVKNVVFDLKASTIIDLKRYARLHTPLVSKEDVDAICNALGDISWDEATAGLDKIQKENYAKS